MSSVYELRANPRHINTHARLHVLRDECGDSSPSVRGVIRIPSINTNGCGGGRAAGVWVSGWVVHQQCTGAMRRRSYMLMTACTVTLKYGCICYRNSAAGVNTVTESEKPCSKTCLFTHSEAMRHRRGKAQTASLHSK